MSKFSTFLLIIFFAVHTLACAPDEAAVKSLLVETITQAFDHSETLTRKSLFRKIALKIHPDKTPTLDQTALYTAAFQLCSDLFGEGGDQQEILTLSQALERLEAPKPNLGHGFSNGGFSSPPPPSAVTSAEVQQAINHLLPNLNTTFKETVHDIMRELSNHTAPPILAYVAPRLCSTMKLIQIAALRVTRNEALISTLAQTCLDRYNNLDTGKITELLMAEIQNLEKADFTELYAAAIKAKNKRDATLYEWIRTCIKTNRTGDTLEQFLNACITQKHDPNKIMTLRLKIAARRAKKLATPHQLAEGCRAGTSINNHERQRLIAKLASLIDRHIAGVEQLSKEQLQSEETAGIDEDKREKERQEQEAEERRKKNEELRKEKEAAMAKRCAEIARLAELAQLRKKLEEKKQIRKDMLQTPGQSHVYFSDFSHQLAQNSNPPIIYSHPREEKDFNKIPSLSDEPIEERIKKVEKILSYSKWATGTTSALTAAAIAVVIYFGRKSFITYKKIRALIPSITTGEKFNEFLNSAIKNNKKEPSDWKIQALAKEYKVSIEDMRIAYKITQDHLSNGAKLFTSCIATIIPASLLYLSIDYLTFGNNQSDALAKEQKILNEIARISQSKLT